MQIIIVGTFVHTPSISNLEIFDGTVGVNNGLIVFLERSTMEETVRQAKLLPGMADSMVLRLSPLEFVCPGMIDTHIHAPQYANCGLGIDLPLLEWLDKYTFPLEKSMTKLETAFRSFSQVVHRTLEHGTTTASYFSSLHAHSSALLADLCYHHGQRAFIGKCNMDTLAPDDYRECSAEASVDATQDLIRFMSKLDPSRTLVSPIITPRFAPSCSEQLLCECAALAKTHNLPIQTHVSENKGEVDLVKRMFPNNTSYTDVYDQAGLLTPRTILAHAVYLTSNEVSTIAARGSGVSHCPTSNAILSSGLANVRYMLTNGVKVGLGTDVSAGYSVNMLDSIRQAAMTSRQLSVLHSNNQIALSLAELFFMATLGGAQLLNLGDRIGSFALGKTWDALLVDVGGSNAGATIDVFGTETKEALVSKWVFGGDDRNLRRVWVNGVCVAGTDLLSSKCEKCEHCLQHTKAIEVPVTRTVAEQASAFAKPVSTTDNEKEQISIQSKA
ncbi:guanine deaminase [Schizosaccharomyces japonicus yFS275]|uniref:Guanine deaminase n=1 Tax=Schizosaccharomyces japonicus (strain yFS275 / FY16936) TaxID=402676 RepID=B6JZF9_SCHJY|nr:guanine deaminase [Schizosaccharomyces japonicus yFS275]EEB06927.1 guanine deaminase [Schizosaccharomyces japonicus yFS275]